MRLASLILLCSLLAGSALGLPAPPAQIPAARTPSCPQPSYRDAAALLAALPAADYACAEELAAALAPRAGPDEADALLALALAGADTRARRNGLRALGRLAESPRGSRPRELALRARGAAFRDAAGQILARERDNFLLQDAVWALDSFFFPAFAAAADLERVAADGALPAPLRERAARARGRLIYPRPGPLSPADQAFIVAGLRSDSPGVRAAAADAAARLRSAQLSPELTAELAARLAQAWAAEPPLALPADAPDPRGTALISFSESAASPLTARAAIARAQDRLAGGGARAEALRAAYEELALPERIAGGSVSIRAGLPAAELPALLATVERAGAAFAGLLGPELAAPLPGEGARPLTLLIFPTQAAYRDYMRAFTPFAVDVDGLYDERTATIYTHQRRPEQSANSLAESLLHELAHHLAAGALFPGRWDSPGYHAEPKGWADEGLAEAMAGLDAAGRLAPRPRQLERLCARAAPPALAELLARRAGYDRFGSFDYDGAWALGYHLLTARPEAARRLYRAYRDGSYRLAEWHAIAGLDEAGFVAEWHAAIAGWCAAR